MHITGPSTVKPFKIVFSYKDSSTGLRLDQSQKEATLYFNADDGRLGFQRVH